MISVVLSVFMPVCVSVEKSDHRWV